MSRRGRPFSPSGSSPRYGSTRDYPSISVKPETHEKLKAIAAERGIKIDALVEQMLVAAEAELVAPELSDDIADLREQAAALAARLAK